MTQIHIWKVFKNMYLFTLVSGYYYFYIYNKNNIKNNKTFVLWKYSEYLTDMTEHFNIYINFCTFVMEFDSLHSSGLAFHNQTIEITNKKHNVIILLLYLICL